MILANGKPLVSCLKGSKLGNQDQRQDRNGNVIDGEKRFKLSYLDKVNKGEPLAQIHLVESYKKYNAEDNSSGSSPCCQLF